MNTININQIPMPPRVRRKLKRAVEIAAELFQVPSDDIFSNRKYQNVVFCRWFIFKLARLSGWSLSSIGQVFNRDHGTVSHGVNQLNLMLSLYPDWREDWNDFYKRCEKELSDTQAGG